MSTSLLEATSHPCAAERLERLSRLSIVVPCHNEAESLGRLFSELDRLQSALAGRHEVEFLFVDDGSQDATWQLLQSHAQRRSDVRIVQHARRRGIAAALATGIAHARGEIVASLDADCTYSPEQLLVMLEMMAPGVDVVVASPYHPRGDVVGVPSWRLALSRLASRLYRFAMRNKLHTYTSCVRVYRATSVGGLPLSQEGFVGVVELLWQVDRRGGTILEFPATLTVRTTGHSKMRLLRTTLEHARFLLGAYWTRIFGRPIPQAAGRPDIPQPLTSYTHEMHL